MFIRFRSRLSLLPTGGKMFDASQIFGKIGLRSSPESQCQEPLILEGAVNERTNSSRRKSTQNFAGQVGGFSQIQKPDRLSEVHRLPPRSDAEPRRVRPPWQSAKADFLRGWLGLFCSANRSQLYPKTGATSEPGEDAEPISIGPFLPTLTRWFSEEGACAQETQQSPTHPNPT